VELGWSGIERRWWVLGVGSRRHPGPSLTRIAQETNQKSKKWISKKRNDTMEGGRGADIFHLLILLSILFPTSNMGRWLDSRFVSLLPCPVITGFLSIYTHTYIHVCLYPPSRGIQRWRIGSGDAMGLWERRILEGGGLIANSHGQTDKTRGDPVFPWM
jgi:hypothetical protein